MATVIITVKVTGDQRAETSIRAEEIAKEALRRFHKMPGVVSVATEEKEL